MAFVVGENTGARHVISDCSSPMSVPFPRDGDTARLAAARDCATSYHCCSFVFRVPRSPPSSSCRSRRFAYAENRPSDGQSLQELPETVEAMAAGRQ